MPSPNTPSAINNQSDTVHSTTTGPTCRRISPWRNTSAFCAPMATIRPAVINQPWLNAAEDVAFIVARILDAARSNVKLHS